LNIKRNSLAYVAAVGQQTIFFPLPAVYKTLKIEAEAVTVSVLVICT